MTLAYATLEDFKRYVARAEILMDEETGDYWVWTRTDEHAYMNRATGEILFWDELKKLPVKGVALGSYYEVIVILGRS